MYHMRQFVDGSRPSVRAMRNVFARCGQGPVRIGIWFVSIGGERMYLWRAVDAEGEVLDILVQAKRDQRAALRLMRKLLRKFGMSPSSVITDRLPSYRTALSELGLSKKHVL
jgi:transposase-like protein